MDPPRSASPSGSGLAVPGTRRATSPPSSDGTASPDTQGSEPLDTVYDISEASTVDPDHDAAIPPDDTALLADQARLLRRLLREPPSQESWDECDATWTQAVAMAMAAVHLPPTTTNLRGNRRDGDSERMKKRDYARVRARARGNLSSDGGSSASGRDGSAIEHRATPRHLGPALLVRASSRLPQPRGPARLGFTPPVPGSCLQGSSWRLTAAVLSRFEALSKELSRFRSRHSSGRGSRRHSRRGLRRQLPY
ncbi:hypothetical protein HPB52_023195 [Rhipicephalus sanguineus]|uniref:Uncharacterized protein n=1 Tax=Rhipicephalus sanguineus TaxID=34632 RepID=A0A9D4QB87_RHISA|nr:hypothetical protein HPB52_023195 [Rhipicephalus sanguineus]